MIVRLSRRLFSEESREARLRRTLSDAKKVFEENEEILGRQKEKPVRLKTKVSAAKVSGEPPHRAEGEIYSEPDRGRLAKNVAVHGVLPTVSASTAEAAGGKLKHHAVGLGVSTAAGLANCAYESRRGTSLKDNLKEGLGATALTYGGTVAAMRAGKAINGAYNKLKAKVAARRQAKAQSAAAPASAPGKTPVQPVKK